VPLKWIDLPFHSSFLWRGVLPYWAFLEKMVDKNAVRPKALVGRWIHNLTARPFGITKQDFEEVYRLTKSVVIEGILRDWKM
jgi:fatty acid synthase subunit beta